MRALLLLVLLLCGCEDIRRGKPGTPGYIPPNYQMVTIIKTKEGEVIDSGWGQTSVLQPYTIVKDSKNRLYALQGVVGNEGDTFSLDISLIQEVK